MTASPAATVPYGFLLLPDFSMMAFASALEPLRMANYLSGQELYRWQCVTLDGSPGVASNGLVIQSECALHELPSVEVLFVCGGIDVHQATDRALLSALRKAANRKTKLGALCTGSYALAKAGLLEGYRCTVHWENMASMREDFPQLVLSSELFEIDRDRITCSGGTAPLDMMLNLISLRQGANLAAAISEEFTCERIRGRHDRQRIPLKLRLGTGQPKLMEAVALMEANLEEPMSPDELARHVDLSRRQLERLFQKHLQCVPTRYYLELRLYRARQLLLQTSRSIVDVAFACGFVSAPHFSKCYRDFFTIPPRDERRLRRPQSPPEQRLPEANLVEKDRSIFFGPSARMVVTLKRIGLEVRLVSTTTGVPSCNAIVAGVCSALSVLFSLFSYPAIADETCMSPYMAKIVGQEDFVYVWTLGSEGVGDEQDKVVTIDVRPNSPSYGKVVNSLSVGGRHEAHHAGYTDDRRFLWAGGLDSNQIFIIDVHTDPARPRLHKVITDFVSASGGVVGPHTHYAMPGRMLITGLSNNKDHGGRTGMVEYSNDGHYIKTHWMPTDENLMGARKSGQFADGYGYDVRALARRNVLITSSFTGWSNYMMDLGKMIKDPEAMKRFGNTVVIWDLHSRKPKQVLDVPGVPLELRCAWGNGNNYCFTTTALTSEIWLIYETEGGQWQTQKVATIADPSKIPLPVDISIAADDGLLWVNTFMDGMTRAFDITDPFAPKQVLERSIGKQVNMISQSWDGERFYFTSSLLSKWDKKGADNEQFFKAYEWDGSELKPTFAIDFYAEKLGRPHIMRFNAYSLFGQRAPEESKLAVK